MHTSSWQTYKLPGITSTAGILALGADIKNTVCVVKGDTAYISETIGDLEDPSNHDKLESCVRTLMRELNFAPRVVACDMHPDYFSHQFALKLAGQINAKLIKVQHHHAHIASCMAENNIQDKVIGVALDGTGLGDDGSIWGGEILIADYDGFRRAAHLKSVKLPGGNMASKEPWRMALAYINQCHSCESRNDKLRYENDKLQLLPLSKKIDQRKIALVNELLNSTQPLPLSSSLGRLFDAVSAIAGICLVNEFEAQAAILLEQCADKSVPESYHYIIDSDGEIDFSQTIQGVISDVIKNTPASQISAKFHNTAIRAISDACIKVSRTSNIDKICLSGGCLLNKILSVGLEKRLEACGLKVYKHAFLPPGDGNIALGQAVCALTKEFISHCTYNKGF